MNKIYARVWSNAKQTWVVTSELAKSGGAPRLAARKSLIALPLVTLLLQAGPVQAIHYQDQTITTTQTLHAGDTSTNITINTSGSQIINTSGSATITTINAGGSQVVNSGGTATSSTVHSGGTLQVNLSGYVINTTLNSGGTLTFGNRGFATNITQLAGGALQAATTDTITGTNALGRFQIGSGLASGLLLENGGWFEVLNTGSATNTTVNSGGTLRVHDGGTASDTIINGGTQFVNPNATAISTVINTGTQNISAGGAASSTTVNNGTQMIYQGGAASSTTLNAGSIQYIYDTGSATDTTLNASSTQDVLRGGVATSTIVNVGGQQNVSNGGSANIVTLSAGGIVFVEAGGTASNVTQLAGGALKTNTSATVSGSNTLGNFNISNGSASNLVLENGGQFDVFASATAQNTTVNSGGMLTIATSGIANVTTVTSGGVVNISRGGWANSGTFSAGSVLQVSSGGVATDLTIHTGATLQLNTSGSVSGTYGSSNLSFTLGSGSANNFVLENSGYLNVLSGGSATNTILNSGGALNISYTGFASGTTINSGGMLNVNNSGFASSTLVSAGGTLNVNGGWARGATLDSGGVLSISNGGVASDITISAGGALQMNTSARVSGTNANGSYDVTSRSARNVILENTGRLDVLSDGNASNTIVNAGGTLNVSSGGILFDTTVLTDGGNLTGAAINSGTVQYNLSGASTQNVNLSGPGQLTKSGGGTLTLVGQLQQQQINLNAGQLVMANLQATTDVIAVAGTHLSMTNGTTFTGMIDPTDITIDGSSTWNVTANSLIDTLTHAGNINFQYGSTPKTLTMTGLTGNGGTITLNSVLGDSSSPTDKVILNGGRASGQTYLAVVNQGGLGAPTTGNGIVVIDAINGATTDAGAFKLKSAVMAGAYNYNLSRNDNQSWYLSNHKAPSPSYRDAMWDYAALTTQSMDYDRALAGTADTRRQYQSSVNSPFWGRIGAGELTHTGTGNLLAGEVPNSTGDYGFVQLGADVWQQNTSVANVRAGAYVAAGGMHNTVSNNNGQQVGVNRDTIYTGGLYLTAESTQGWRVDSLIQVSHHDLSASPQDGTSLSTKGTGWLASVEGGWTVPLRSAFTLEPQLQYTIQGINLNDSRDGVADMRWSGSQRQQVRAGVKLANQVAPATASNLAPLSWWVTPSITHSFGGSSTMQAGVNGIQNSQVNFNTGKNGTGLSLDGGVNMHVRDNAALGVRGGYSHTLNGNSAGGYYGQISLNLSFH